MFKRLAALLRRLLPQPVASSNPSAAPDSPAQVELPAVNYRRPIVAYFDVLGHPVMIVANLDGSQGALDYVAFQSARNPNAPEVPVDWVRTFGVEIDSARFDGLILSHRFRAHVPIVAVGDDGAAVVVTAKGAITRDGGQRWPQWKRGFHVPLLEYRKMQRAVGQLATDVILDSQRPNALLSFKESVDRMMSGMVGGLNEHVMERHGGIHEDKLPGFARSRFTDNEIAESKRVAADVIAKVRKQPHSQPASSMLASVADDGRAMVLNNGWAASRDANGKWSTGLAFSADDLKDEFRRASDSMASTLLNEARTALAA